MPGVTRQQKGAQSYWRGEITIDNKLRRQVFSIIEHGEDSAWRQAVAFRMACAREVGFDKVYGPLPSTDEIERIEQAIRTRFGEKPQPKPQRAEVDDPMYALSRYEPDAEGKGGAWVAVLVRRNVSYHKRFDDAAHGGETLALAAAHQYRDTGLKEIAALPRRECHQILTTRNLSGVAGVNLVRRNGFPSAWLATIMTKGRLYSQRFAIRKHGFEHAYELAVKARTNMLEKAEGDSVLSPVAKLPGPDSADSRDVQSATRARQTDQSIGEKLTDYTGGEIPAWVKIPSSIPAPGISRISKAGIAYWQSEWSDDDCTRTELFSIPKHGEKGARQLAIERRALWRNRECREEDQFLALAETSGTDVNPLEKAARPRSRIGAKDVFKFRITRRDIDAPGSGACWIVILNGWDGRHRKHFHDGDFGGREQALDVACRYRDGILKSIDPALLQKSERISFE